MYIRVKKKSSSNLRVALLSQRVLFFQGGLSLRTRAAAIRIVFKYGRVIPYIFPQRWQKLKPSSCERRIIP